MSIFGPLVSTWQIEQAVQRFLARWMDTYLAETERQHGLTAGTLQRPRGYETTYDFENWPERQLPALIVMCPGTVGDPEKQGNGLYGAWFEFQAGVLVEDTTEADARKVTALHQAALEGIVVQHAGLGGIATETRWRARRIALPDPDNRTLAIGESTFHTFLAGVLDHQGGPVDDEPGTDPEAPYPDWPTVVETEIETVGLT